MCGILGFISPKKPTLIGQKNLTAFMNQGMYVGGLRGRDSTGLMVVGRDNYGVEVVKQAVEGATFVDTYNVEHVMSNMADYACGVIHHRSATKGQVLTRNAHPFQVGDVSLVHNGTIFNHRDLPNGKDYTVDSNAIAAALDTAEAVSVLEEIDGAFTLVWFDSSSNTFSISRNNERPLSIAYTKDNNILFSSEEGMLKWLADRNKIEITDAFTPDPLSLLQWKIDDGDKFSARNFSTTKFEEKIDPYAKYYDNNYGNDWSIENNKVNGQTVEVRGNAGKKKDREKALARYSLKVGDLVEFVGYQYTPYATNPRLGCVSGVDCAMQFEVESYSQPSTTDNKGWSNALCQARVITVKDDLAYPWWVTIIVGTPTIVKEDFFEKKSFETVIDQVVSRTPFTPDANEASNDQETTEKPSTEDTMVTGPQDIFIEFSYWRELTEDGCCSCTGNLYTPELVKWDAYGSPWCRECWEREERNLQQLDQDLQGI